MASKRHNGNAPLGARIDATKNVNSAFAQASEEIAKRSPKPNGDTTSIQTPSGVFLSGGKGNKARSAKMQCVLGDMLTDPENENKTKLREGYLTGGGGSESVAADNLTPTIGNHVYLIVTWTAQELDDVLQSGGILGTVTPAIGTSIPDDTVPTISSLSGVAHIPLGQWVTDGAATPSPVWQKAGCGNVGLYFCPGQGFIYSRI